MGAGPFSSDSATKKQDQTQSGPVTASQGTAAAIQSGKRSRTVAQGSISLEKGASLGGLSLGNAIIGRGATLNITAPQSDNSALDQVSKDLEAAVKGQADNTAAALASIGNTMQPGRPEPDNKPPYALAIVAGLVAVGLIALIVMLRRK